MELPFGKFEISLFLEMHKKISGAGGKAASCDTNHRICAFRCAFWHFLHVGISFVPNSHLVVDIFVNITFPFCAKTWIISFPWALCCFEQNREKRENKSLKRRGEWDRERENVCEKQRIKEKGRQRQIWEWLEPASTETDRHWHRRVRGHTSVCVPSMISGNPCTEISPLFVCLFQLDSQPDDGWLDPLETVQSQPVQLQDQTRRWHRYAFFPCDSCGVLEREPGEPEARVK